MAKKLSTAQQAVLHRGQTIRILRGIMGQLGVLQTRKDYKDLFGEEELHTLKECHRAIKNVEKTV